MSQNKINPCLWFHTEMGSLSIVTDYYKTIFGDKIEVGNIIPLGKTPSGNAEMCDIHIFGQKYTLMSTEMEHHPFNDSIAFCIHCEDQTEIDTYWNYFTSEGKESQCGWCHDKFGLRWQIIPNNLGKLMSKPNSWKVMMNQKKIVIAEYEVG